jgi:long-chain acyl-CoA synthetase
MIDTLASLARTHARTNADRPAITYRDRTGEDRTMTYAELDARSSRVAQALLASGVRAGDRVAFLDKNTPEFFEVQLGAAKIGAVMVAVNWRLAPPEIAFTVNDACAPVIVVGEEFRPAVDACRDALQTVKEVVVVGDVYEAWIGGHPATDPGFESTPDDIGVQFYTSGTTGVPKGVMLSNRSLFGMMDFVRDEWGIDEHSMCMVAMPLFHVAGAGWALCGLTLAAHNVLLREVDLARIVDDLQRYRVTHAVFVPAVLQFLLITPGVETADFSALRHIIYGASPISEDVLVRSIERFACSFTQAYGLTETNGAIVTLPPSDHDVAGPHAHRLRSAGVPLPGVELLVVDDRDEPVPTGEVGEIWIRSGQNMVGYWNRPDDTAAALRPDGWLRSGDAGYLDRDGYLYIHDRVKDMIVSGGENIYPAEVESVLMAHPGVADAAVIGVPHDTWGETVKAVVVRAPAGAAETAGGPGDLEGDGALDEAGLLAFCRERLAHYKCPTSVDWVDALPRNPTGKILKRELREPYWAGRDRRVN